MKSHFRPQSDFISPEIEILKLDNGMPQIISMLEKKLGPLNSHQEKINAGDKTNVIWTQKALKEFNSFYAVDFHELGYEEKNEITVSL